MNLLNSPIAKICIDLMFWARRSLMRIASLVARLSLFVAVSMMHVSVKAWEVDLSRRAQDLQKLKASGPTAIETKDSLQEKSLFSGLFTSLEPTQEVVIMNTEKGFVPETLRLRAGQNYKVHVINVNEKEKNVSFVLDAFSEHHGTFFGQPKTFEISPKIEGIFSFQCPETAKQGRIVVAPVADGRRPASE